MSRSTYERRVRLASEAATWGVGAILLGTAALPTTDPASRVGLLVSSLLLFVFAVFWFHLIPEPWLGRLRFATGTAITQIIAAILLVLTGGGDSRYFSYYLLPTLATAFGMRLSGTIVTGIVAVVGYVTILVTDTVLRADATALDIADSEHDQGSQRVRERYGFGAGLFMPLMHRSEVVGVMAMSSPVIRHWTPAEIRLAEVIAEASAAAVASSLAFDALRVETD